jgi:hypothetical protein
MGQVLVIACVSGAEMGENDALSAAAQRGFRMWLLMAPALAYGLLAAHFLRDDAWILVAPSIALIPLLAVPRPWAAHIARVALVIGALEWLRTIAVIAAARISMGVPFGRMIVILGTVALLTLAAALVFRHPKLRRFYRLEGR